MKQDVGRSQNSQLKLDCSSGRDQSCVVSTKSRTVAPSLPLLPPHAHAHTHTSTHQSFPHGRYSLGVDTHTHTTHAHTHTTHAHTRTPHTHTTRTPHAHHTRTHTHTTHGHTRTPHTHTTHAHAHAHAHTRTPHTHTTHAHAHAHTHTHTRTHTASELPLRAAHERRGVS